MLLYRPNNKRQVGGLLLLVVVQSHHRGSRHVQQCGQHNLKAAGLVQLTLIIVPWRCMLLNALLLFVAAAVVTFTCRQCYRRHLQPLTQPVNPHVPSATTPPIAAAAATAAAAVNAAMMCPGWQLHMACPRMPKGSPAACHVVCFVRLCVFFCLEGNASSLPVMWVLSVPCYGVQWCVRHCV